MNVSVHIDSGIPYATTTKEMGAEILKDTTNNIDLRPSMPIYHYNEASRWIWIVANKYNVLYKAISSGSGTSSMYANFCYARK